MKKLRLLSSALLVGLSALCAHAQTDVVTISTVKGEKISFELKLRMVCSTWRTYNSEEPLHIFAYTGAMQYENGRPTPHPEDPEARIWFDMEVPQVDGMVCFEGIKSAKMNKTQQHYLSAI